MPPKATQDAAEATRDAAKAAADEASATLQEAQASRQLVGISREQIRRSLMPVVMPTSDPSDLTLEFETVVTDIDPGVPNTLDLGEEFTALSIPVANVGLGPAFNIEATVTFLDRDGNPSVAPQPTLGRAAVSTGLGAGHATDLQAVFKALDKPLNSFSVSIIFWDAFDGRYEVSATYLPAARMYRKIIFTTPDELSPS